MTNILFERTYMLVSYFIIFSHITPQIFNCGGNFDMPIFFLNRSLHLCWKWPHSLSTYLAPKWYFWLFEAIFGTNISQIRQVPRKSTKQAHSVLEIKWKWIFALLDKFWGQHEAFLAIYKETKVDYGSPRVVPD